MEVAFPVKGNIRRGIHKLFHRKLGASEEIPQWEGSTLSHTGDGCRSFYFIEKNAPNYIGAFVDEGTPQIHKTMGHKDIKSVWDAT
ncbi:hypothetical protein NDU88_002051 [Pleurodeles waltl]|uniref:Uncharacterized protein n=1 Tax=Pleurodeles waltl TaxID=8319 RepID=A0AAV7U861_PLEWA|nr:hypothetical protein NDU88_002051 [Pleurodeles waltl]